MSTHIPTYRVHIIANNTDYDVTGAILELSLIESDGQLAQAATIKIANIVHKGSYLTSLFDVIDRVQVFATYNGTTEEVFRGFVWEKDYSSGTEKALSLSCYDNLIYLQKSEICEYFTAGKSTQAICTALSVKWGIGIQYDYRSITHPKLPLDGLLGDALTDDILNAVKKQTGVKYVLRSTQDVLHIKEVGSNKTIYEIAAKKNAGPVRYKKSMDDVVTQVIITGKKGDDERTPIEATVKGRTNDYGTIQKVISKDKDTKIAEAKNEAQEIIDEKGAPTTKIHLDDTVDIPFVHKGDRIKVNAGNIVKKYCIVLSITHDAMKKTMDIVCELDANQDTGSGTSGNSAGSGGKALSLSKVPLYISSDASKQSTTVTGTYYLYDGIEINGRYRITNSQSRVGAKPVGGNVTGWIDKEYA